MVTVARAIAETFKAESVDIVFGLAGDANLPLIVELEDAGTHVLAVRNEAAAVAMAAGYAHATSNVGVCSVTCGPGLTQCITALIGAVRRHVPVVLFAGFVSDRHEQQYVDQRRLVEDCGAMYVAIDDADGALDRIYDAFYAARALSTVVVLSSPPTVLDSDYPWGFAYSPVPSALVRQQRTPADADCITEVVQLLSEKRRPVVLAGMGAERSGAGETLRALATRLGAVLATTLPTKGLFDGETYSVGIAGAYSSRIAEELLSEADVVLAFGASMNRYTTEGGLTFPQATLICIDVNSYSDRRYLRPDIMLVGDAKTVASQITAALDATHSQQLPGYRSKELKDRLEELSLDSVPAKLADDFLDPRAVVRTLESVIAELDSDQITVVVGVGHFQDFVIQYLRQPASNRYVFTLNFGSIGEGLTTAIGVALGRPQHRVIVIDGDGSLMENIQELDTVARYALNIGLLVMNDSGFGAERHKLTARGTPHNGQVPKALSAVEIPSPDFASVARAFHWDADKAADPAHLIDGLRALVTASAPYLLDVRISPDVVSDPFRKLYFAQENSAPHQAYANSRAVQSLLRPERSAR